VLTRCSLDRREGERVRRAGGDRCVGGGARSFDRTLGRADRLPPDDHRSV